MTQTATQNPQVKPQSPIFDPHKVRGSAMSPSGYLFHSSYLAPVTKGMIAASCTLNARLGMTPSAPRMR
jgi:hypothetical protein